MYAEMITEERREEPQASPSHSSTPRPSTSVTRSIVALALTGALCAGCAASNYDFHELSSIDGPARGARLSEDLLREQRDGTHDELYDIDVLPLARTHLSVFAESDDEGVPDGYVEADIDAYLPLFGIVDATVNRYDDERSLYEHHEFKSYLWGLFQTHREQVDTKHGLREKKMRRLLWLFGWRSSPKYVAPVTVYADR